MNKNKSHYHTAVFKANNIILLFFAFMLASCGNVKTEKLPENDACTVLKDIDAFAEDIRNNADSIIKKSDDSCVLGLLDTLATKAIETEDASYLALLESLKKVSDGYVSEYFIEVGARLFYGDFKDIILYAYDRRQSERNYFEELLIEAISVEMADTDDVDAYQKKVNDFIDNQIRNNSFSQDQLTYIDKIRKKFDPTMFD